MQTGQYSSKWNRAAALWILLAVGWAVHTQAADQELAPNKSSEERPTLDNPMAAWGSEYTNWVELGIGNFFVDGNRAAFQQRYNMPSRIFGGVESLHWEKPITKDWLLQLDGRGIANNEDYSIKLNIVNPKFGFLRGGYREFRTWYNRHGGYSPLGNVWLRPSTEEGYIDRGEAWVEGGLTLPEIPKLTFGYSHLFRDGTKDSTSWGDSTLGIARNRKIVPSFWDIDEARDIFRADLQHSLGTTDFGVGMRYEFSDQKDKRLIIRETGGANTRRAVTQRLDQDSDLLNVHAFTETKISEKVLLTTGYAYTKLDTDNSGSRIYGSDFDALYDPLFARRQFRDEGYFSLEGGGHLNQYLMNLNLLLSPWESFSILPALRVEKLDEEATSDFIETDFAANRAAFREELFARSEDGRLDVTESLEARYTGLPNWSFYARGEWWQGNGNLKEEEFDGATGARTLARETDSDRMTQKYTVGANWYPLQRLNFGSQYYHKIRETDYDHVLDSTPNTGTASGDGRYPAFLGFQNFETDDINFRVTWRPRLNVTLVTRYDFQISGIDTHAPALGTPQTAETTSHIISQSVGWSPLVKLFLQGSLAYVLDSTDTPAQNLSGGLRGIVQQSENNYWNASFLAAYHINEKTDLQAQYFYYLANNYNNNSSVNQPYNSGAEEQGVTVTLLRSITKAMRWSLKYGFFTNHERLYGGHTDYRAHLVYSSIQYRF